MADYQDKGKLTQGKTHSVCSAEMLVLGLEGNTGYQVSGMKETNV